MKRTKNLRILLCIMAVCMSLLLPVVCCADAGVSQIYTTGDGRILFYVRDLPGEVQSFRALVGNQEADPNLLSAEKTEGSENLRFRTVILVDNSLSISSANRPKLAEVLNGVVENHAEGELFQFSTFSNTITTINTFSENYEAVHGSINGLTYNNQDAYLQDALFETLAGLNNNPEAELDYKRIIVVSDGMNETQGGSHTTSEVMEQQRIHHIPIYCLGSRWESNTSGLDNFAALGRESGGNYYSLDDTQDMSVITEDLKRDYNVWCLGVTIPQEACAGDLRSVQLTIQTTGSEMVVTAPDVRMPQVANQAVIPTETPIPAPTATPLPTNTPVPEPTPEEKTGVPLITVAGIGGGVLLLLILLVILILVRRKGKTTVPEDAQYFMDDDDGQVTEIFMDPRKKSKPEHSKEETTQMMFHPVGELTWIFSDLRNPQRKYSVRVNGTVVLGRNSDFCDFVIPGDKAIGRHHCNLITENGKGYLEDLNSLNGTFVNRTRINRKTEVHSGDTIRFGNTELRLELR